MTMNPPHARIPRTLVSADPGEALARATILLGRAPRDCLLVLELEPQELRTLACTPLDELWVEHGREALEAHLTSFQERGCTRVLALLVLGDGHEEIDPALLEDIAGLGAAQVLAVAAHLLPEPLRCAGVWTIGGGSGRLTIIGSSDAGGVELLVSPPARVARLAETRAAARAVLDGVPLPQDDGDREARLQGIAAAIAAERSGAADSGDEPGSGTRDGLEQTLDDAVAVLDAARRTGVSALDPSQTLLVARLLDALEQPDASWALLEACARHTGCAAARPEDVLPTIVEDPGAAPCAHLLPGGPWTLALEDLIVIASHLGDAHAVRARRSLRALLVMLYWWNRFGASAGAYVDAMRSEDPEDPLAHLLGALLRGGPEPAWCRHGPEAALR